MKTFVIDASKWQQLNKHLDILRIGALMLWSDHMTTDGHRGAYITNIPKHAGIPRLLELLAHWLTLRSKPDGGTKLTYLAARALKLTIV